MRNRARIGSAFRFARTPGVPEGAKPAARQAAEVQWKQFFAHLADRFSDGHRFTDGLPPGGDGGGAERVPAQDGWAWGRPARARSAVVPSGFDGLSTNLRVETRVSFEAPA